MQWYLKALRQYVDFSGRARRTEFWMFVLFNTIISVALSLIDYLAGWRFGGVSSVPGSGFGVLQTIYQTAATLPGLAVFARRLHDIGRSGWWQLLFWGMILLLQFSIGFGAASGNMAFPGFFAIATVVVVILFIVWLCTDGEAAPNRWGANPKLIPQRYQRRARSS